MMLTVLKSSKNGITLVFRKGKFVENMKHLTFYGESLS